MSAPLLLERVAVRMGVGLWRHRLGVVVAALIVAVFGGYELTSAGASATTATTGSGDCADTAMAALVHTSDATARAAYDCLGPEMRTSTSEDQFVASLQQRPSGSAAGQADRVADRQTPAGKIVFFTVSAPGAPPEGYIVYLDANGKIARVE